MGVEFFGPAAETICISVGHSGVSDLLDFWLRSMPAGPRRVEKWPALSGAPCGAQPKWPRRCAQVSRPGGAPEHAGTADAFEVPLPMSFSTMRPAELWVRLREANAFGANTLISAAANILLAILALVTGILAARLLGPGGRGELVAIQTWPTVIATLGMLGTGESLVYYTAQEAQRAGSYLGSALTLSLLSSAPFALTAYFAMPLLLRAQPAPVMAAARTYLLIIPIFALFLLPSNSLRGRNDFVAWNMLRTMPQVIWLVILVVARLGTRHDPGLLSKTFLIALGATSLPIALIIKRRISGPFLPRKQDFGPLLRYGLPCMMSTLPLVLNLRLDQMLMAVFLPPMALGLYVVAVAWSGAINPLIQAVALALFPEVASRESDRERTRVFIEGNQIAFTLALVTGTLLMLATP
jgi:O-antigen/teichoic acid export membrane protein